APSRVIRHLPGRTAPAAAEARPAPKQHVLEPPKLLSMPAPPASGTPTIGARSGILVDGTTGAVLWVKHPHARRLIASTTKIMTATLVLERLPLDTVVTVPPAATRTPLVREGLRPN